MVSSPQSGQDVRGVASITSTPMPSMVSQMCSLIPAPVLNKHPGQAGAGAPGPREESEKSLPRAAPAPDCVVKTLQRSQRYQCSALRSHTGHRSCAPSPPPRAVAPLPNGLKVSQSQQYLQKLSRGKSALSVCCPSSQNKVLERGTCDKTLWSGQ